MDEFTTTHAARSTRRAIAKLRKAVEEVRACSGHWGDLDGCMESELARIEDSFGPGIEQLDEIEQTLDETYPVKSHRRHTNAPASAHCGGIN